MVNVSNEEEEPEVIEAENVQQSDEELPWEQNQEEEEPAAVGERIEWQMPHFQYAEKPLFPKEDIQEVHPVIPELVQEEVKEDINRLDYLDQVSPGCYISDLDRFLAMEAKRLK